MIFTRILVGVDGSPEGDAALAQARRLLAEGGELVALVVCVEHLAVHTGLEAARVADELHAEAEETAARARSELAGLPGARVELVHGRAEPTLLHHAERMGATLVVVGSHSRSRAAGIVLGSVATALLHEAPTSVLIARAPEGPEGFPRRIAAGTDGSPQAEAAVAVARSLAGRFDAGLHVVVAEGGKPPHAEALGGVAGLERDPRAPVDAILAAAAEADLVVVGSRGLHGPRALGSVSERVAHRAPCSVLVVRGD